MLSPASCAASPSHQSRCCRSRMACAGGAHRCPSCPSCCCCWTPSASCASTSCACPSCAFRASPVYVTSKHVSNPPVVRRRLTSLLTLLHLRLTHMFVLVVLLVALVVVVRGFMLLRGQRRHLGTLYLSRCLHISGRAARGSHQTISAQLINVMRPASWSRYLLMQRLMYRQRQRQSRGLCPARALTAASAACSRRSENSDRFALLLSFRCTCSSSTAS